MSENKTKPCICISRQPGEQVTLRLRADNSDFVVITVLSTGGQYTTISIKTNSYFIRTQMAHDAEVIDLPNDCMLEMGCIRYMRAACRLTVSDDVEVVRGERIKNNI